MTIKALRVEILKIAWILHIKNCTNPACNITDHYSLMELPEVSLVWGSSCMLFNWVALVWTSELVRPQGVWLNSCLRRSMSAWCAVMSSGSWPRCGAARAASTSSTWTASRNGLDPQPLRQTVQHLNSIWILTTSSTDPHFTHCGYKTTGPQYNTL